MINASMFSSATGEWATPQALFDSLNAEFGPFDLDPCATPENAKCPTFYTREDDGLAQPWFGRVFVNPPYGRQIGKWVERCATASVDVVVALLPSRTDTSWWHHYVMGASEIRFLRGRVRFNDGKVGAPFPSAVVIWRSSSLPGRLCAGGTSHGLPLRKGGASWAARRA